MHFFDRQLIRFRISQPGRPGPSLTEHRYHHSLALQSPKRTAKSRENTRPAFPRGTVHSHNIGQYSDGSDHLPGHLPPANPKHQVQYSQRYSPKRTFYDTHSVPAAATPFDLRLSPYPHRQFLRYYRITIYSSLATRRYITLDPIRAAIRTS